MAMVLHHRPAPGGPRIEPAGRAHPVHRVRGESMGFYAALKPGTYFDDKNSITRGLPEPIPAQEEEQANDMHGLLVTHEDRPVLETKADCHEAAPHVYDGF